MILTNFLVFNIVFIFDKFKELKVLILSSSKHSEKLDILGTILTPILDHYQNKYILSFLI